MSKKLTDRDYCDAAERLGCSVAANKAVARVESGGRGGFDGEGRLLIRFEGHKFREFTERRFDDDYPRVSYRYHKSHKNCGKHHSYNGFNIAFGLAPNAALLSCSLGMFQPMGFNYEEMGYESVSAMWDDFKLGERQQLMAFVRLIEAWGLADELRRATAKDFAAFARRYNGASYKDNNYDAKMLEYYQAFKEQNIDCARILSRAETENFDRIEQDAAAFAESKSPQISTRVSESANLSEGNSFPENDNPNSFNKTLSEAAAVGLEPLSDLGKRAEAVTVTASRAAENTIDQVAETVTETAATAAGTVEKTTTEIKNTFDPKNIPAFIPRFGKQWLFSLIPGGGLMATILAKLAAMPDWMVFTLGFFTGVTTVLFFQLVVKHREIVGKFIITCYESMKDPESHNLIPTPAVHFKFGERREFLERALR